jgi:hypothetical protein
MGMLRAMVGSAQTLTWVLSPPIPLRVLLAAARLSADEGHGGAVTLIQRFGSAANLDIHLHCLVLDGVYCCGADGVPSLIEAGAPTDDEVDASLHAIIARLMKMLTRRCVLVEDMGQTDLAEPDADSEESQTLRRLGTARRLDRKVPAPRCRPRPGVASRVGISRGV